MFGRNSVDMYFMKFSFPFYFVWQCVTGRNIKGFEMFVFEYILFPAWKAFFLDYFAINI